jgi:hypothetical protein
MRLNSAYGLLLAGRGEAKPEPVVFCRYPKDWLAMTAQPKTDARPAGRKPVKRFAAGLLFACTLGAASDARQFTALNDVRDRQTATVTTVAFAGRTGTQPIENAPEVCHLLNRNFLSMGRTAAHPCSLPLPMNAAFSRPAWTKVDPAEKLDVVKSWAFWQVWALRATATSIQVSPDASVSALVRRMAERWSGGPITGEIVWPPPAREVQEFIAAGWAIYGARVIDMIESGAFRMETARFDYNADGMPDQVYRLTRLNFGLSNQTIEGRPTAEVCSPGQPSEPALESGIYVSDQTDPLLHRSLVTAARLNVYDMFFFKGRPYSVSRGHHDSLPQLGWLSVNSPTSYVYSMRDVPPGQKPGIGFENLCEFNPHDLRP